MPDHLLHFLIENLLQLQKIKKYRLYKEKFSLPDRLMLRRGIFSD